ncbi:MAG: HAMP domain-containing sensor histidine kinase [bacterium]|nr:HAMP domain-containing sensor histidine kinase [bacterium]
MNHRSAIFWSILGAIALMAGLEALLDVAAERVLADGSAAGAGLGPLARPLLVDLLDVPLFVALALATATFLARRLERPLRALTRATEQLAAERFPEPLQVPESDDDLSRLARSFNRMSATLRSLLERERALSRFATHELRTPLSALKLQVERAQRAGAPNPATLETMARNVRRMEEVIDALLSLARTGERDQTPVGLADLVDEVLAALPPAVRGRVDLMSIPADVSVTDGALVQRALHNLVDNALAYGAVPVHVHLNRDGRELTLRVRDRGPGVPEEALAHLARPYYRAAERGGGMGLGLALVAFIAQTLEGELGIRNLDPGFEATLRLPIVAVAADPR